MRFPRSYALPVLAGLIGGALWFGLTGVRPTLPADMRPQMVRVQRQNGAVIYVSRYEITAAQWNMCHRDGACTLAMDAPEDGQIWPATGVSYPDVAQYLGWLSQKTGHAYRLPTSEEWRELAGPVLPKAPDPIFTDPQLTWASAYLTEKQVPRRLRPSGAWATVQGISDLNGNVWEWTSDCYNGSLPRPENLSDCPAFVVEGEHQTTIPYLVRDPANGGCAVGAPPAHLGLRVVSDQPG